MSGPMFKFYVGGAGKSSSHVQYISRESAVLDRENGTLLHNMPSEVSQSKDYAEMKERLASYAWAREESEIARHKSAGEVRTHYRTLMSFEKNVETQKVKEMTNEWLKENFPNARAAAFIHKDTNNTHAHVWIDARKTDGKKLDLGDREYRKLDEKWNRIYAREMGIPEKDHLDKKRETLEWKKARMRGEEVPKPARVDRKSREMYQNRELRNYGNDHIKARARNNERTPPNISQGINAREGNAGERQPGVKRGERALNQYANGRERAGAEIDRRINAGERSDRQVDNRQQDHLPGERAISEYAKGSQRANSAIDRRTTESKRSDRESNNTESRAGDALRGIEAVRGNFKELDERNPEKKIERDR